MSRDSDGTNDTVRAFLDMARDDPWSTLDRCRARYHVQVEGLPGEARLMIREAHVAQSRYDKRERMRRRGDDGRPW